MSRLASLQWYCVRVPTKREKITAEILREIEGVQALCPMMRYRKATRRGPIWWQEAVFPGYVLANFSLTENERNVMFCHGVRGLVHFGNHIPFIDEKFITEMQLLWNEKAIDEVLTVLPTISAGEEVELAHGPMSGMKGIVTEVLPAAERVKVLIEFLGQENNIDIDIYSLLLPRKPLAR